MDSPSASSCWRTSVRNEVGAFRCSASRSDRTYMATCRARPSASHWTACGRRHSCAQMSSSRRIGLASGHSGGGPARPSTGSRVGFLSSFRSRRRAFGSAGTPDRTRAPPLVIAVSPSLVGCRGSGRPVGLRSGRRRSHARPPSARRPRRPPRSSSRAPGASGRGSGAPRRGRRHSRGPGGSRGPTRASGCVAAHAPGSGSGA